MRNPKSRAFLAGFFLEAAQLKANKAFVFLSALAAISFLVMVSLFGLTGSYAPVAYINYDRGPFSSRIIEAMNNAHHSFSLRFMTPEAAQQSLLSGGLVGIVTIPNDYSAKIQSGQTADLDIQVDNVNVDLTNDVQRALPAAIVAAGRNFPGVRLRLQEHDVLPQDTGYIPYLVVSALALDAMLIAGILGALVTAREWERKTLKMLRLSPASLWAVLAGRLSLAAAVSAVALSLALFVIVRVYGVIPVSLGAVILALGSCIVIFVCLGAWLGVVLKHSLAVVPLMFGLIMPLYVDSGALEPTRFDGDTIWHIAHLSPIYYAVGLLEWAFHGLHVTPEPVYVDLLVLVVLAGLAAFFALRRLATGGSR